MKDLIKKWWFWTIILVIIIIISITSIMMKAFDTIKEEPHELAKKIEEIYKNSMVYTSARENTIIIELTNFDSANNQIEFNEIFSIIKTKISNNELSRFDKLIVLSYLNSNNNENLLLLKTVYSLPNFTQETESKYIVYEEYESMYNTLKKSMKMYNIIN